MTTTSPEDMRTAMAEYVRSVHQAYLSAAAGQPPGIRGQLGLVAGPFTVVAAGVRNLHVIATRQDIAAVSDREVHTDDSLEDLRWRLRFFDPSVIPTLGMIDESQGAAGSAVRRALGIDTHLYHLIVQPGSQLTGHHAGHAGAGLAMGDLADVRDFETIRAHARGREHLVDEMAAAARAGLIHAQALLAARIAPGDEEIAELAAEAIPDVGQIRKTLIAAVRR